MKPLTSVGVKILETLNGEKLELEISLAQLHDAKKIVEFLNQVGGESDFLTFGFNQFPYSVEEELKIIRDSLEKESSLMLIGKINCRIIAHLFLDISSQPRLSHIGHLGICLKQQYWGLKIGKHLIDIAIIWAKNKSLKKIQLQVRHDNARAVKLYQSSGFKIEGLLTQSIQIDEKSFDEYIMGLDLRN